MLASDVKSTPFTDTSTATDAGSCAGATQTIFDEDTQRAATDTADPKRHNKPLESTKFAPTTVTDVEPDSGPLAGCTDDTRTTERYEYCTPELVKSTPFVLTSTATVLPATPAGVTQTQLLDVTFVATTTTASPKRHVTLLPAKLLPYTKTSEPPIALPARGDTEDTTVCAVNANSIAFVL